MAVFPGAASCNLLDLDRRFRKAYCLRYRDDSASEPIYTRLYSTSSQKDSHLHTCRRENLKSHTQITNAKLKIPYDF